MENIAKVFTQEQIATALEASQRVADNRLDTLSEELLIEIFPLPYSSSDDAVHEMSMTLLEKILLPYI